MSPWRIRTWSREHATGVVTSDDAGDLPFDASAATVDDFVIGERVRIALERRDGRARVASVTPDDPRFTPRTDPPPRDAPALRADLAERHAVTLASLPVWFDLRFVVEDDDVVVEGDHDSFAHGARGRVRFRDVSYVELPLTWPGRSLRLARPAERAYLATRTPLAADSVAVSVVTDDDGIYFIVAADLDASGA